MELLPVPFLGENGLILIIKYRLFASIFALVLKYIAFILIFLGLLVQSFNKLFIVLDLQLNSSYIAKNLCENRNKPQMHCNGKCHRMKVMKQEQKKDQDNPERKADNKFEVICGDCRQTKLIPAFVNTTISYPHIKEVTYAGYPVAAFHPPQV